MLKAQKCANNKTVKEGYGTWRLCKIINEKGYRTHNGAKFQSNTANRILKNYVYAGYFLRNGKLSPHIPQLQIVENTFKFHNKNLYSKLGVTSRKQLVEYAKAIQEACVREEQN